VKARLSACSAPRRASGLIKPAECEKLLEELKIILGARLDAKLAALG
jgi:hypothetical protein